MDSFFASVLAIFGYEKIEKIPVGATAKAVVDWLKLNLGWLFDTISDAVNQIAINGSEALRNINELLNDDNRRAVTDSVKGLRDLMAGLGNRLESLDSAARDLSRTAESIQASGEPTTMLLAPRGVPDAPASVTSTTRRPATAAAARKAVRSAPGGTTRAIGREPSSTSAGVDSSVEEDSPANAGAGTCAN